MTRTQFAHHPGCFSQETPSRHLQYIYQCPFWLSKHISSNPIPVLVRSWSFCNAEDQGIRRSLLMAPSSGCTHPSAVLSQDDRHQSCKAHYSRCTIRIFARDWVLHCGRRGTWSRSRTSQAYHRGTCRPKGPEIQLEPCRPQGRLDTSFDPSGRWKCLPDMLSSWCRHQSGLGHRHTWAEARSALWRDTKVGLYEVMAPVSTGLPWDPHLLHLQLVGAIRHDFLPVRQFCVHHPKVRPRLGRGFDDVPAHAQRDLIVRDIQPQLRRQGMHRIQAIPREIEELQRAPQRRQEPGGFHLARDSTSPGKEDCDWIHMQTIE